MQGILGQARGPGSAQPTDVPAAGPGGAAAPAGGAPPAFPRPQQGLQAPGGQLPLQEPVRPPSVEPHGAVAILFLGNPHFSVRFHNYVRAFSRFGFYVDWLGYCRDSEPLWLRRSGWVRHWHMDAAFLSPAPDSFLFWLIYPVQLVFDFLYTLAHLFFFCRGNLDLILCMASPFRPSAIFACYFAARLMRTRVILDVSGLDASSMYTGSRARLVRWFEQRVGRMAVAVLPSKEGGEGEDASRGEEGGSSSSSQAPGSTSVCTPILLSEAPSLRSNITEGAKSPYYLFTAPLQSFAFTPTKHHSLFFKLAFAQPERTLAGSRTLFHYLRTGPGGAEAIGFNPRRPLLILIPCAFRGEEDFGAAFSLLEHLEDYFSGLQTSVNQERFRSAVVVFSGRSDPLACPRGPEYFEDFSGRMQRYNDTYRARRDAGAAGAAGAAGVAARLAKKARGARYCRAAYVYLEREDYFCLLSCADLVVLPRTTDRFTGSMLEALMYRRYLVAKIPEAEAKGGTGAGAEFAGPSPACDAPGSIACSTATLALERCNSVVVRTTEDLLTAVDVFLESREAPAPQSQPGNPGAGPADLPVSGPHVAAAPPPGSPSTANPGIAPVMGQIRDQYSFYRGFERLILPLIAADGLNLPEYIRECKEADDKLAQYYVALDGYNKAKAAYEEMLALKAVRDAHRAQELEDNGQGKREQGHEQQERREHHEHHEHHD